MRVLGVDFGFRRIGLAVGDTSFQVASPLRILDATGTLQRDAENLSALCRKEEAEAIVLGVPYEVDGSIGRQARICLKLAESLREKGIPVYTVDESLTSSEVETELKTLGMKAAARRRRVDSAAACRILERFFRENEPKN